jgi:hypothetical protein
LADSWLSIAASIDVVAGSWLSGNDAGEGRRAAGYSKGVHGEHMP